MGQEVIKQISAPARDIIMKHYVERKPKAIRNSFKRLGVTLKNVRNEKKIFLFLLAFFFYIDGVYTIIPSTKNTDIAPTPIFTLPVTCKIRLITVVPRKDAPFPHMSIRPKYSPDFSGGMILAKYDRDNA